MSGNVTLRDANGEGFRLVMRDGSYRDFQMGVLVIADGDPCEEELLTWAKKQSNITIIMGGTASKVGVQNCPVCGEKVSADDLPVHMDEVHVDYDSIRVAVGLEPREEEPKPRRSRR